MWNASSEGDDRAGLLVLLIAMGAMNAALLRRMLRAERLQTLSSASEAQSAQRGVAVAELRFRDAIESMAEGVLFWDASGRLAFWNRRFIDLMPGSAPALRPGIDFENYLREVAVRLLPDTSSEATAQWIADWQRRRAQPGQTWAFIASSGRHIELVERPTSDGGLVSIYRDVTEQVAASQRAADAEALLRDGIDSMEDGFLLLDRANRLVLWNARYAELMPYVAPLLRVGDDWFDVLDAALIRGLPHLDVEQRRLWIADRIAARTRGESVEFEAGGRILRVTDRQTSDGGYVIVANDVTQDKRLVERLVESEARLRDGLDAMGEGVALWDSDDRLIMWNRRYLELLPHAAPFLRVGMTLRQVIEETALIRYPEWSPEARAAHVEERLRLRRTLGQPFPIVTPSGRILEVVDHAMSSGGFISVFRDVTAASRAADQLAASEALFRDGLESITDGVLLYDAQGRIQTWNSRYVEMFPEARDVLRTGMRIEEFLPAVYVRMFPENSPATNAELLADRLRRFDVLDKSFERRLADGRVYELTDRRTSAGGLLSIHRDITSLVRSHEARERALKNEREMNTRQRRFVSIASHEFRTPLAIIDGARQRIAARLTDRDPEILKRLDRIRDAVLRMTGIIERILSSGRVDEGRIEMNLRSVNLGELLRELCDRQRQINPQFVISLSSPGRLAPIEADPDLLDQVFTNLLSNAVKYSGAARQVDVIVTDSDVGIRVAVRDRGIGVAADEIPSLFTRYFRARSAQGISGTGIGLHFVRELVALHGGRIDVASELGKGSTFLVDLPRLTKTGVAPEEEAAE